MVTLFEFWVANLIWAALWPQLHGMRLWALIAAGAVCLVVSVFVLRSLDSGWSWANIFGGAARVMFSFFLGVALSRLHLSRPPKFIFPAWTALLVLCALLFPTLSETQAKVYDLLCVLAILPTLVYYGAEAYERQPKIGEALGNASYGIYVIHWPLLVLIASQLMRPDLAQLGFTAAAFILAIALHYLYDTPTRAWLSRKFSVRRP
jgi:peptidoglycan/LPS O-acetylase OafA/YrhL